MNAPTPNPPAKVEYNGNVTVLTLTGVRGQDVENMVALELKRRTGEKGERHLMLDFSNVDYLTSEELEAIIRAHRQLRDAGGRLTLFNLNLDVFQVFTATHLHTLLNICREDEAALPG